MIRRRRRAQRVDKELQGDGCTLIDLQEEHIPWDQDFWLDMHRRWKSTQPQWEYIFQKLLGETDLGDGKRRQMVLGLREQENKVKALRVVQQVHY